ncbi:MAG: hypothetical protein A4S09_01185 [Proteobacteria bacterium SG_bin7]|nr:MAG: hypothetical protein A4S09_01185 [Proteobacteria bacterium SG_bin7]
MKFLTAILFTTTIVATMNASADDVEGVLVLAHGSMMHLRGDFPRDKSQCQIVKEHQTTNSSEHKWENAICAVVEEVNKIKKAAIPVEAAFGMTEVESFQHGVDRLVSSGMTKLRIIPLYISTYSGVIRQQKEIFGITKFRGDHQHDKVVYPKAVTKVIYENALDDAIELSRVLLQRAKELSRYPQIEELILVGHGPVSYEDDAMWVRNFDIHNQRIQDELRKTNAHFNTVHAITVQDDAPNDVREAKTRALRQLVAQATQRGHRALILPVLIAPGSIENGILERLRGLNFDYVGHMLTPDPEMTTWIVNQINRN